MRQQEGGAVNGQQEDEMAEQQEDKRAARREAMQQQDYARQQEGGAVRGQWETVIFSLETHLSITWYLSKKTNGHLCLVTFLLSTYQIFARFLSLNWLQYSLMSPNKI
jgi:hypothetical protein